MNQHLIQRHVCNLHNIYFDAKPCQQLRYNKLLICTSHYHTLCSHCHILERYCTHDAFGCCVLGITWISEKARKNQASKLSTSAV